MSKDSWDFASDMPNQSSAGGGILNQAQDGMVQNNTQNVGNQMPNTMDFGTPVANPNMINPNVVNPNMVNPNVVNQMPNQMGMPNAGIPMPNQMPNMDNQMPNQMGVQMQAQQTMGYPPQQEDTGKKKPKKEKKPKKGEELKPKREVKADLARDNVAGQMVQSSDGTATMMVDPTKSKQLGKRKNAKNITDEGVVKKPINKFAVLGLVAILGIGGFVGFKFMNKGSDTNFLTLTDNIINTELGKFTYTIDVKTSEKGDTNLASTEITVEDLESTESVEGSESSDETGSEESETTSKPTNTFVDWVNADGVSMTNWRYPKYQIVIDGNVPSLEPYQASYKITLKTENHSDVLTELVCYDDTVYIDLSSMGAWLRNSKDSYLSKLGDSIPQDTKWVSIPFAELSMPSRFAEDAELTYSEPKSIKTVLDRNLTLFKLIRNTALDGVSKDSFTQTETAYSMTLTAEDKLAVTKRFLNMLINVSSYYDGYIQTANSLGLLDEGQLKQSIRERDNILNAFSDVMVWSNGVSPSDLGLSLDGIARQYADSNGNTVAESNITTSFRTDSKEYFITAKLVRTMVQEAISKPEGSSITKAQLSSPTLVYDTLWSIVDYLNPTALKLEHKAEMNPERIDEAVKNSLIKLVNATPEAEIYLTSLTVDDYIEKYASLDRSAASQQDIINAKIVEDFLAVLGDITGDIVIASSNTESTAPAETEQYPELIYEDPNIKITAKVNSSESDASLVCLDLFVLNKASGGINLDLTEFSLRTLLSSMYPANNITLLRNYDNSWDETKSPNVLSMGSKSFAEISLYFVVSSDSGYMDLWFGDTKLGEIIAY